MVHVVAFGEGLRIPRMHRLKITLYTLLLVVVYHFQQTIAALLKGLWQRISSGKDGITRSWRLEGPAASLVYMCLLTLVAS